MASKREMKRLIKALETHDEEEILQKIDEQRWVRYNLNIQIEYADGSGLTMGHYDRRITNKLSEKEHKLQDRIDKVRDILLDAKHNTSLCDTNELIDILLEQTT